jgi:hypothetical protein
MVMAATRKVVMWQSDATVAKRCRGLGEARDLATLQRETGAAVHRRRSPCVHGADDLLGGDALQMVRVVDRCVSELALDRRSAIPSCCSATVSAWRS